MVLDKRRVEEVEFDWLAEGLKHNCFQKESQREMLSCFFLIAAQLQTEYNR